MPLGEIKQKMFIESDRTDLKDTNINSVHTWISAPKNKGLKLLKFQLSLKAPWGKQKTCDNCGQNFNNVEHLLLCP